MKDGIIWDGLLSQYGLTSVTMQSGIFNRFVFAQLFVWCEAHQKGCGPDFGFAVAGELCGPGKGIYGAMQIQTPTLVM